MLIASAYLICFLSSILLSLCSTYWMRRYATDRGWVAKPELDRHVHTRSVPRLGGVAIFGSFMIVAGLAMLLPRSSGLRLVLPAHTIVGILGSALIIFLLGLYDDIRFVGPFWKFGIQAIAAFLLYAGGVGIHRLDLFSAGHPLSTVIGLPLTVVWILLITNAFNLIDGLDGLAAGSAFFSTIVVFVTSLLVPNATVTLLTIALAGVILGFLRFNFHPASIFLGDSGSTFIGFMLATLALAGSEKAPTMIAVAIPVVSFGFPILDVALSVSRRFLGGKPLFSGDGDHIHHKLLKRGLSQRGAVLVLYGVTAVFALLSLVILHDAAMIALVLTVIGLGIGLGVQYLGYAEFVELQNLLRKTAVKKRSVADNVAVRHAIEALNSCTDLQLLCKIVKEALQTIGFDGFRLGKSLTDTFPDTSLTSFKRTADGDWELLWDNPRHSDTMWELRLELLTETQHRLGHFSLLRVGSENPLLVDFNLLSCEFRIALSQALLRVTHGARTPMRKPLPERSAHSVNLAAGVSSD
jgi:UDP-GlcNAc:undecaprenyl-phosphate/decaprenyl-phosphate GlcNAc-1-phosphate transferase